MAHTWEYNLPWVGSGKPGTYLYMPHCAGAGQVESAQESTGFRIKSHVLADDASACMLRGMDCHLPRLHHLVAWPSSNVPRAF